MLLGVSRWVFRARKEGLWRTRGRITLMSEQCLRALLRFRKKLADVLCLPQQSRVLTNPFRAASEITVQVDTPVSLPTVPK